MQETILITGGTGLVGSRLTQHLIEKRYEVRHISRKTNEQNNVLSFNWDLKKKQWDLEAIKGVDYIIHLAGAGVANGRWTKNRKKAILESRIVGSQLVSEMVEAARGKIKRVISASAVGYYGINSSASLADETSKSGNDFLANVCVQWEKSIASCNTNVAILRTGVVLSSNGGAIPKMLAPIKWSAGAPLGSGKQLMPWIHIDDLCEMYLFALENKLEGIYNAVAPQIVSNKEFTQQLAKSNNRKIWMPNVPLIILKLMLGEMADMLLTGVNASSSKMVKEGFKWRFPTLNQALNNLS